MVGIIETAEAPRGMAVGFERKPVLIDREK
jgi:hypothetical protein